MADVELAFTSLTSSLAAAPADVAARIPQLIECVARAPRAPARSAPQRTRRSRIPPRSLYGRQQWHQLTFALLDFVKDPRASVGDNLLQVRRARAHPRATARHL